MKSRSHIVPILVLITAVGLLVAVAISPKDSGEISQPKAQSQSPKVVIRRAIQKYQAGNVKSALELLEGYADESAPDWAPAASMAAAFSTELQQLDRANRNLQTATKQDPSHIVAWRQQLEYGLTVSDPAISMAALKRLHALQAATPIDLAKVIGGSVQRFEGQLKWYRTCVKNEPNCFAATAQLIRLADDATARDLCQKYDDACKQSLLLACAIAQDALRRNDLSQAVRALRPFANDAPNDYRYWLAVSRVFRRLGSPTDADECLQQSIRLAPFEVDVLAEALTTTGKLSSGRQGNQIRKRWDASVRLRRWAKEILSGRANAEGIAKAADDLAILQLPVAAALLNRSDPKPEGDILQWDLTATSMPDLPWAALERALTKTKAIESSEHPVDEIRFTAASTDLGLNVKHINFRDDKILLATLGSGIGVIDIDSDQTPDLLFAQSAVDNQTTAQSVVAMRRSSEQFGDVTSEALPAINPTGSQFSHGISVGDFNNDGFEDFFVCRFGPDLLFCNNGDGTFSKTKLPLVSNLVNWSTSAVFTDFNNDGAQDLYVARYLNASIDEQMECNRRRKGPCLPSNFDAAADKVFINDGTGGFVDDSDRLKTIRPAAGLGIEVADFHGDGAARIFVANDGHPNHLVSIHSNTDSGKTAVSENAFTQGVAVGGTGSPDACMGIALADFDHNGHSDLLVTNFEHEANNLYLASQGMFVNSGRRFEIAQHSTARMGWGAIAADFNGNTFADVLLANSHLSNRPMPYEIMTNFGGTRFSTTPVQVDGTSLANAMGRCVVTADFNNDQRPDIVSSTLNGPAVLLLNQSNGPAMRRVQLVGRSSSRTDGAAQIIIRQPDSSAYCVSPGRARGYMGSSQNVVFVPDGCKLEVNWNAGGRSDRTAAQLSAAGKEASIIIEPSPDEAQ